METKILKIESLSTGGDNAYNGNHVAWDILRVDKTEYNKGLYKLSANGNTKIIPEEKYYRLLEKIKEISKKQRKNKTIMDYRLAKKYAVLEENGKERLFYKPKLKKKSFMMVTLEETLDIINEYHLIHTNHGGRIRMLTEIRKKYYNITVECVVLYLSMCYECKVIRAKCWKRKLKADAIKTNDFSNEDDDPLENSTTLEKEVEEVINSTSQKYPELYSRAQVDLLTVTSEPNEEYKYLMVYRDYATKFINLKALAGISVDETAEALLEIFLVFGAPNVLQSKNGIAVLKPICSRISSLYSDIKVVYSEKTFPCSTFRDKSNEDILKKLNAWLIITQNTKWQNGVKYIQHSMNTSFHETLCRTPNELLFGSNPSKGISSFLRNTEHMFSESDLLSVLDKHNGQVDSSLNSNLLHTESVTLPKDIIKLEVDVMSNEDC